MGLCVLYLEMKTRIEKNQHCINCKQQNSKKEIERSGKIRKYSYNLSAM